MRDRVNIRWVPEKLVSPLFVVHSALVQREMDKRPVRDTLKTRKSKVSVIRLEAPWGTSPPKPPGVSRFWPKSKRFGRSDSLAAGLTRASTSDLMRRSGCSPAEPYPPIRRFDSRPVQQAMQFGSLLVTPLFTGCLQLPVASGKDFLLLARQFGRRSHVPKGAVKPDFVVVLDMHTEPRQTAPPPEIRYDGFGCSRF